MRQAQAIINNYLKAKYPEFDGVSIQQVEVFLKGLQDVPPKFLGDEKIEAHVLTSDANAIADGTFTDAVTIASRTEDQTKPGGTDFSEFLAQHPAAKLVDQDKAISTLALPYVGKELLQAISKTPDGANSSPAASYSGNTPCVITTTIAKSSEKGADAYAKLHVVHNKQTGKSLVVAFTKPNVEMGRDSSVTVVNAKDRDAIKQVRSWLGGNAAETLDDLRAAFEERNAVSDGKKSAPLEELLLISDKKIVNTFSPTMLDGSHNASRGV